MAKSLLLKQLVNNEIGLMQALDRLYVIAHYLKDDKVCDWIRHEKKGYFHEEPPAYRKTSVTPIGTYQIISCGNIETYRNVPLPTSGIPEENMKQFNNWLYKESVASLLKQKEANDKGDIVGVPVDPIFFQWFQKNTNIIMRSAILHISSFNIETMLDEIKNRIIDIILLYEDNFGSLDDIDVDIKESESKALQSASKSIIDGNFNGDTRIIIKKS